jgi:hypothetical protein
LFALIALNIPLSIAVIIIGRRSVVMQRIEMGLGLLTCAAMVWAVADGPILKTANSDRMAKILMVAVVAVVVISVGIKLYRSVRPTPNRQLQALR